MSWFEMLVLFVLVGIFVELSELTPISEALNTLAADRRRVEEVEETEEQ